MSPILKLFMVGYFGGALIFAGCLLVILTNLAGITSIQLSGWPFFGGFTLMMGSKMIARWLLRRQEAKHG